MRKKKGLINRCILLSRTVVASMTVINSKDLITRKISMRVIMEDNIGTRSKPLYSMVRCVSVKRSVRGDSIKIYTYTYIYIFLLSSRFRLIHGATEYLSMSPARTFPNDELLSLIYVNDNSRSISRIRLCSIVKTSFRRRFPQKFRLERTNISIKIPNISIKEYLSIG